MGVGLVRVWLIFGARRVSLVRLGVLGVELWTRGSRQGSIWSSRVEVTGFRSYREVWCYLRFSGLFRLCGLFW